MTGDYQKLINLLEQIEREVEELEKDILNIYLFQHLSD